MKKGFFHASDRRNLFIDQKAGSTHETGYSWAYLKDILDYDESKSLLKGLATKRGWEQSVLYETAIIMLEEAKK